MKIERITVPDKVAAQVGRIWPTDTWSQVVARALVLLVDAATLDDFGHVANWPHAGRGDVEAEVAP